MEPPVWRAQTLTNAYAYPATEGNAVRSVWDQLQLITTNNSLSKTTEERDAELHQPVASVLAVALWKYKVMRRRDGPEVEDVQHVAVMSRVCNGAMFLYKRASN